MAETARVRASGIGRVVGTALIGFTVVVLARASWWGLKGCFAGPNSAAFWPLDHLFRYTLAATFLGLEAAYLVARPRLQSRWAALAHIVAIVCGLWIMGWGDARHGWRLHINAYDRVHYFGNTVWLWLIVPSSMVLFALAVRDSRLLRGGTPRST